MKQAERDLMVDMFSLLESFAHSHHYDNKHTGSFNDCDIFRCNESRRTIQQYHDWLNHRPPFISVNDNK